MHTLKVIQKRIYQKRFALAVKWVILVEKCSLSLSVAAVAEGCVQLASWLCSPYVPSEEG